MHPRLSNSEADEAIGIVLSTNAIKRAQKASREFIAKAKSDLNVLPESKAKHMLITVADFIVERGF